VASDYKIILTVNEYAKDELVPLLEDLKSMGDMGASRSIILEDWGEDGGTVTHGFDGDGPSAIENIEVEEVPEDVESSTLFTDHQLNTLGKVQRSSEYYPRPKRLSFTAIQARVLRNIQSRIYQLESAYTSARPAFAVKKGERVQSRDGTKDATVISRGNRNVKIKIDGGMIIDLTLSDLNKDWIIAPE